jgi:hypothetical protein
MGVKTWVSGVEKDINEAHVRVGGSWKAISEAYVRVGNEWKLTVIGGIPQGLIAPYAGTTIPEGWSEYTLANNRYIVGASSSRPPESTYAGDTISVTTSAAGEHLYGDKFLVCVTSNRNTTSTNDNVSGGAHSHSLSFTWGPPFSAYRFIRAQRNHAFFPGNTIVLSYDTELSLSKLNVNNRYLRGGTGEGGASELQLTTAASGAHWHGTREVTAGSIEAIGLFLGSHSHAVTVSITDNLRKALVYAYTSATRFLPPRRCIAFWGSLTPPPGWLLCDGTNGTPDLRGCFLYVVTQNAGSVQGSGTISVSFVVGENSWTHTHRQNNSTAGTYSTYAGHGLQSPSHTHTINPISNLTYSPPSLALAIIMKK